MARWGLAALVLLGMLSCSASTMAPTSGLLAQRGPSPLALLARADWRSHAASPGGSKIIPADPAPGLLAGAGGHPLVAFARANEWRKDMWHRAKKHAVKIVPPPVVEPGVVACTGSAIFLAAGFGFKCAPRVLAGLMTALIVSAPVQILDIAIMENASGKRAMPAGMAAGIQKMTSAPITFLRSQETALVYCLFGATYATANICKAIAVPTAGTLVATTLANMGACFYKDSELARLCGQGPRREFPKLGYLSLAARDMLSMGSTFTLPPILGGLLKTAGMPKSFANNIAQTSCPVLAQVVQVPFHLMALSFYNSPDHTFSERMDSMRAFYKQTLFARMGRALPCYGAGGVLNTNLQTKLVGLFHPHF